MIEIGIWCLVAVVLGIVESVFKGVFKFDIHILFTLIRGLLITPLFIMINYDFLFLLVCALVFPFLHDGFYYLTRNILSKGIVYPKGFIDQSTTTTAIFSANFFWRLIFFVFGMGMSFVFI
jgi:hypothetical protein